MLCTAVFISLTILPLIWFTT